MAQEPIPQPADALLTELLPRIQAAPAACQEDLRAALALAISVHNDALRSSVAKLDQREADLRRVGLAWARAHHPLDPLLELTGVLAEKMADFGGPSRQAVVAEAEGQIIRAILSGFQQAYRWAPRENAAVPDRRLLATALLFDLEISPGHEHLLADSYAIIAICHPEPGSRTFDEEPILAHFDRAGISGVLCCSAQSLGYVLIPSPDPRRSAELAERFHGDLPAEVSLALAWRVRDEVPSGRQEVRDIAMIVSAAHRPPGVYQLNDFLVEYAALQEPSVADGLARMLGPISDQPMLLATLRSFIAANGNRSKAAADLEIHRSTLDYRLQRVEQLTGTDPTSAGGLQLLSIALTTHTALRRAAPEEGRPG